MAIMLDGYDSGSNIRPVQGNIDLYFTYISQIAYLPEGYLNQ